MQPAIIVHGGAWNMPPEEQEASRQGTRRAVEAGWAVLAAGGTAADGVEAAILVMEDDETFDAGRGSHLNTDGHVEMDAGSWTVPRGASARWLRFSSSKIRSD